MSSDIPLARERLTKIAAGATPSIRNLIRNTVFPLMTRAAPVKRARSTAVPIGPAVKAAIKAYAAANPNKANRDIGRAFGVDGGRVSEILTGKR